MSLQVLGVQAMVAEEGDAAAADGMVRFDPIHTLFVLCLYSVCTLFVRSLYAVCTLFALCLHSYSLFSCTPVLLCSTVTPLVLCLLYVSLACHRRGWRGIVVWCGLGAAVITQRVATPTPTPRGEQAVAEVAAT